MAATAVSLALVVLLPMNAAVVVAMAAASGWCLWRVGALRLRSPVVLPLASFFLLAGITLFLFRDVDAALRWGRAVVIVAALFVPAAVATPDERVRICRLVVYFAGGLSLYALVEVALDLPAIWGPPPVNGQGEIIPMYNEILVGSGLGRAEVTLVEPLLLSFLLVVALGVALRSAVLPRRRTLLVVVLLIGIVSSGSRSAAAVVAVLFFVAAVRSGRVRLFVLALVTLGAAATTAALALLRPEVVERVLDSPSVAHRLAGIEASVELIRDQPWWRTLLGNGYGQVLRLFREGRLQDDGFHAVDNQFVHTFAELGLAGLAVLVWILWKALRDTDGLIVPAVAAAAVMFLSFDVLANAPSLGVLALLLGLSRRRAAEDDLPRPDGLTRKKHFPGMRSGRSREWWASMDRGRAVPDHGSSIKVR